MNRGVLSKFGTRYNRDGFGLEKKRFDDKSCNYKHSLKNRHLHSSFSNFHSPELEDELIPGE